MRVLVAALLLVACADEPRSKEDLGRRLFEDPGMSTPAGQGCVDCHDPKVGFADPEGDRTSSGAIRERFGVRNAQGLSYVMYAPPLHREGDKMVGGLFWDGRANTLEEQAKGPLLNPLEMNNASESAVAAKAHVPFAEVASALAAFQRTREFAPFSSKYDRFVAGTAQLDAAETRGMKTFEQHCTSCHPAPLFTNWSYANLGLPRFADNPFYLTNPGHVDRGLGATTGDPRHDGMFRVPSLRNVARTAPYGHNGYFRRLDEMIAFHAKSSLAPEVPATVDRGPLASFAPSPEDIRDLVAFLATLTDGV